MPNSLILLAIQPSGVAAELQLPLNELELAFGHQVNQQSDGLVERLGPQLRAYILQHIHPTSPNGRPWQVSIRDLYVQPVQESPSGPYRELTAQLWLVPPPGESTRQFTLNYDVIIHQVVTHTALVSVRQDWETGFYDEKPTEIGVIRLDVVNNTIPPLPINQAEGSLWQGFRGMVSLGMSHISEGVDHLLFLLVLLLPAPLLNKGNRWGSFGGVRYALVHLLKIVTAFTIGHSITLIAGALNWIHFPAQPIELLIAVSILVSAIHAMRPLFPGREPWVAAGFGLIHGLAFASTLANLQLDAGPMTLSILGFNLGIELMQLIVIGLTIPWLILLSRTSLYTYVRIGGAVVAVIAAVAWLIERFTERSNTITSLLESERTKAVWLLVALAILAIWSSWRNRPTASRK